MNQFMLQYAIQTLPILAGALALIILRSIKISRNKIVIFTDEVEPVCVNASFENDKSGEFHTSMDSFLYDSLVINGKLDKNLRKRSLDQQAFEALGYLNEKGIKNLPRYLENSKNDTLTLFVNEAETNIPMRIFSKFSESTGLLLWYAASGNMEVKKYA